MQTFSQDPREPSFVQDSYPFYARLRGAGDIAIWQDYGMPCAASHRAVDALLRDRRLGRAAPPGAETAWPAHLAPFAAVEEHSMLELEPPRHTRLRGLVLRAFTSRRIAGLGPEIGALAHGLIDGLEPGGDDLLAGFAERLPVIVIARLLGVPEEMADDLLRWSHDMVAMYQAGRTRAVEDRAAAAARDFADFLRGYIDARRAQPADDLLTHLIAAEEDGSRLSTDELIATCILLLNAGHEATVHAIGNGVKALLERDLRVDEAGAEAAAEEILRFDPPLHLFTRWVYEDVEVFGARLAAGTQVGLLLASAGRDPEFCTAPDRFDPARAPGRHAAFGGGVHFCVGAPLARLELKVALPILFARLPRLRLAEAPRYRDSYHFRGLEALPVRWD
ncbi:cytochrome P450 [Roseivivax isoporae]|uniref:Cytochrome P450 n=1 Tax=Roseivivax isoporae LMG 25204 TaxID=1449351 RepID=X7F316_9RHOB|nr:cytochrome P450 [Roseivivax isoporae]ETX27190.1 cytochrome P450 [Roseivivax isoporae LMG 25204]